MQELISSFIIQSKECKLAGIGKFRVITAPAEADIINKKIIPPVTEVLFTGREDKISDELVKYVASKTNITTDDAIARIKKWCSDTAARLNNNEEIALQSLGTLLKGGSGNVFLKAALNHSSFFTTVNAERVIHKDSEHAVLVGDNETTLTAMSKRLSEEDAITDAEHDTRWRALALILLTAGLIALFFYFYMYSFSLGSTGNQIKEVPATNFPTYTNQ